MSISERFAPLHAASRLPFFNAPRQRVLDAFALALFNRKYAPAAAAEAAGRPPSVLPFDAPRLEGIARDYRFNRIHFFEATRLLSDSEKSASLQFARDCSLAIAAAYRKHFGHPSSGDGLLESLAISNVLSATGHPNRVVLVRRTTASPHPLGDPSLVAVVLLDSYLIDPALAGYASSSPTPLGFVLRNHSAQFGNWIHSDIASAIDGNSISWRWKNELPIVESFLAETPHSDAHLLVVLDASGFAGFPVSAPYSDVVMSLVRTDMLVDHPGTVRQQHYIPHSAQAGHREGDADDDPNPVIALRTIEGTRVAFIKYDGTSGEALSIPTDIHRYTGGFEWGYAGSGPQALSAAIAAKVLPELDPAMIRAAASVILESIRYLDSDQDSHDIPVKLLRSLVRNAGFPVEAVYLP